MSALDTGLSTRVSAFQGRYRFLSNFWPAEIEDNGIVFPTLEHAYQAAKTHDPEMRRAIARLDTPGQAKRAGRHVRMRPDWEDVKIEVMAGLLAKKFSIPLLRMMLLATGDLELIEGNDHGDKFWGVYRGFGKNYLGRLLMIMRDAARRPDARWKSHGQRIYAGIGSRETPREICDLMVRIGERLASRNWLLRSGGADGADLAFETGSQLVPGARSQIFLPWPGFNKSRSPLSHPATDDMNSVAALFHPSWNYMNRSAQQLHARNVAQILDRDLNTPADAVLCWTRDGEPVGGTAQAIRIAEACGIPIINLGASPEKWDRSLPIWNEIEDILEPLLQSKPVFRPA